MNNFLLPPMRPPGAVSERIFSSLCVRCGKCVEACPHNTLKLTGGFGKNRLTPHVDLDAPCQLCMKCTEACPTGALDKTVDHMDKVKIGQAYILKDKCHNYTDGVMCMTCYDRCPARGRGMVLEFGITPQVSEVCAGCGVCAYVCPVDAIVVLPKEYEIIPDNALPLAKSS